jgi:acyl-CoA thioester hydrolase
MSRPERPTRAEFPRFVAVGTRWEDNDVYGHVNNVVYYSFFDTAVNGLLVEAGVLDLRSSEVVGLVVSNSCDYFASVAFPDSLDVGVRVDHIGRSSVRYIIGVFRAGENDAAARGEFTHVYVDRATQKPVAIPGKARAFMETLHRV